MAYAPPQHRADAPIVFIAPNDPAWAKARIVSEIDALKTADKPSHIVGRYLRGETRGDTSAPGPDGVTIGDYLDGSEDRFTLKRLQILDVARFRDMSPSVGKLAAARVAYSGDIEALVEERGAGFVFELGEFALLCSEAPRPGESRRSDS